MTFTYVASGVSVWAKAATTSSGTTIVRALLEHVEVAELGLIDTGLLA